MDGAILEVRNLDKKFGGIHVTNDLSYSVAAGTIEAIIGPNGAGKSTFFNLLTGYHKPSGGTIRFRGRDITRLPPHRIAQLGIARAFQISNIFHRMTVWENVRTAIHAQMSVSLRLFDRADRVGNSETEDLLRRCGLLGCAASIGGELPQGDKKRLELALALARKPSLLLLDEPTAGMSREEAESTMDLVARMNAELGVTIVFTEHDMGPVFKYARRLTLLNRGAVVVQGTPAEIRNNAMAQSLYLGESVQ